MDRLNQAQLEEIFRQISLQSFGGTRHRTQQALVDALMEEGCLGSASAIRAFSAVDRARFLTEDCNNDAYLDAPVRDGKLHQSAPSVYARALEALELRPGLTFLNVGSGTGYFSALVAQLIGPNAWSVGVERHNELVQLARARCADMGLSNIRFQCGNCFCIDVDRSMKFDRIYIGAGAPRDARFLYKLLKQDGVIVGPFEDEEGHGQSLSKVRCCGGKKYAVSQLLPVQFAGLVRPGEAGAPEVQADTQPLVLSGPRWEESSSRSVFPNSFRNIVIALCWMNRLDGTLPNKLPWEVWTRYILSFLPFDAFDPLPQDVLCAACGGTGPRTRGSAPRLHKAAKPPESARGARASLCA
uniref:Protein-L-isoaspartate O-methyltransferase n=1 Tax=Alexandrium monilatum TaxID=311494 RepID=A0A7S4PRY4_9DINO